MVYAYRLFFSAAAVIAVTVVVVYNIYGVFWLWILFYDMSNIYYMVV